MTTRRTQSSSRSIDRGWAWVVLCSTFLTFALLIGLLKCFGMIFAEILARYQKSASGTSTMLALSSGFSMFIGPLVAACCDRFTCRAVAMTGGIVCSVGFLIPAFCDTLEGITLSFGILTGIGFGMCFLPCSVMIGYYFERYRSLANGILFSAAGFGGIIMPFLINYVIDNFGVNGALMTFAGLSLQTVVFSSLYRPLPAKRADAPPPPPTVTVEESPDTENKLEDALPPLPPPKVCERLMKAGHSMDLLERFHSAPGDELSAKNLDSNNCTASSLLTLPGSVPSARRDGSAETNGVLVRRCVAHGFGLGSVHVGSRASLYFSALDIANVVPLPALDEDEDEENRDYDCRRRSRPNLSSSTNGCKRFFTKICCWTGPDGSTVPLVDFGLLKNARFVLFVTGASFFIGLIHISMLIPPHCLELGMTKAQVATLLSFQGASDMAGRLLIGILGDRSCVKSKRYVIFVSCLVVLSTSTFVSVSLTTFAGQAAYLLISSLARGIYAALINVMLIDLVGRDRFSRALGLTSLAQSFFVTLTPLVIGGLRDWTGSYSSGLFFLASCLAVSAFCFISIIVIDKKKIGNSDSWS